MLVLALQILFVGLIVLGLYSVGGRLGLSLLFVFVASTQFLQHLLATTVYVELFGRYPVSPGSAVLFAATLFSILLVYLKEDIETSRGLIYGVVLANGTLTLVAATTRWAIATGYLQELVPMTDWFLAVDLGVLILGSVLLLLDAFVLLVTYEVVRARLGWIPLWARVVLSLSLVLALDTVLFVGLGFRDNPDLPRVLIGGLFGKTGAGVLYGSLLAAFLAISRDAPRQVRQREIRDPFSILTFGRRYGLLQQEVAILGQLREVDRQRAEVALRGARLGAWDWNVQTGDTYLDGRWAAMLGYTRDEIAPQIASWEDRVHPEDRDRVERTLTAHLEGATPFYEVEHRLRTRSGRWKWILSMGKVIEWDADGNPVRMTGTHMDIDERKKARARASRLGHVLEHSLHEIYTFDVNSLRFLDVNAAARDNLGYTLAELRQMTPLDLKPEFTIESFSALIDPLRLGQNKRIEFTTRHRRKDGSLYPVKVQLQLVTKGEAAFVALIYDLTAERQAEDQLKQLERRYRELFEDAPLKYVVTHNRDEIPFISDCNNTFLERIGFERDEVLGKQLTKFYSPESTRDMLAAKDRAEIAPQNRLTGERQLVTRTGDRLDTLFVALPELDASGATIGSRIMYVDITARKRAEDEVRRGSARLRQLSARLEAIREDERKAIAREIHDDLGQALTGLKLELAWLGRKIGDPNGHLRERVEAMGDQIDRSLRGVKDLSARLRPAVLDDLGLREAIQWQAREMTRRYGIACVVEEPYLDDDQMEVREDVAISIFRILQEALTNILRHADARHVVVSLMREDAKLVLRVADDGKGIDPRQLDSEVTLGVLGMRERAEFLGGSFHIRPGEQGGTVVEAEVPL